MIRILFVCLGNICRSPMAEFVFRDMVKKEGLSDCVVVESAATSREELGNPPHPGTKKILSALGISTAGKYARQITKADYDAFDYIIGMEQANIRNILRITGGDAQNKVCKLLDFSTGGDIADPWYTGNFEDTYRDVVSGCTGLLEEIRKKI